jgi:hypothetical protein
VSELCRHMLPRKTALGLYGDRQYDRIRGFVVLAHAEVEYCLEKLGEDALLAAEARYLADGKMRQCLASLLAWIPLKDRPPSWATWTNRRQVRWSVRYYRQRVLQPNHGASKRHILNLAEPLGILEPAFDNTWLLLADTLSTRRGSIAHTGRAAQSVPNPTDQRRDFRDLVVGLRRLDRLLTKSAA